MFLENLQNSPENNCARVSFLVRLQASAWNFIKKEPLAQAFSLYRKLSFPLRISSGNLTKCAVFCGFSHIYEEILNGKLHFLWIVSCEFCEISKNTFSYRTLPVTPSAVLVESPFAIRMLWKW